MTVNELIEKLLALPGDVRERDVLIDGIMDDTDWTPYEVYVDDCQPDGWKGRKDNGVVEPNPVDKHLRAVLLL